MGWEALFTTSREIGSARSGVAELLEVSLDGLEFVAEGLKPGGVLLGGEPPDEVVLALAEIGFRNLLFITGHEVSLSELIRWACARK